MLPTDIVFRPYKDGEEREKFFEKADLTTRTTENYAGRRKHKRFGLCWNCQNFMFRRTTYNREYAVCEDVNGTQRRLHETDPVVECTSHVDRFLPTLHQMWSMAVLIDPPARSIGFLQEEGEEQL